MTDTNETEKALEQIRAPAQMAGPSEMDLMEGTFIDSGGKILTFEIRTSKARFAVAVTAIIPIVIQQLRTRQYIIVGRPIGTFSRHQIFCYDSARRIGSVSSPLSWKDACAVLAKIDTSSLPFNVSSPFDGIILRQLNEAGGSLTYDELRKRTRIKRGLPSTLQRMEWMGLVSCDHEKEGGKISFVDLV